MQKTQIIIIGGAVVLVGFFLVLFLAGKLQTDPERTAGNEATPNTAVDDAIPLTSMQISVPEEGAQISSPVTVSGEARGFWFFEASAPVKVLDNNGLVIGQGNIEAQGDWMTEEFVPFTGTITFTQPSTPTGQIVFARDNPSGLAQNSEVFVVNVTF